jgi:hypothetical protein
MSRRPWSKTATNGGIQPVKRGMIRTLFRAVPVSLSIPEPQTGIGENFKSKNQ